MGKLFFIRHGQTSFNVRNNLWHAAGDPPEEIDFQYSQEYIDPPLTPTGQQEILNAKSSIESLPIDCIYVSPLVRALESCDLLFRDTENRPRVIVDPLLTEWMHVNHDTPLWPNNYKERFSYFDWSLMPDDFFIKSVITNSFSQQLDENNYTLSMIRIMKNILPLLFESRAELFHRTRRFIHKIREEITDHNILIVGHSAFYRHLTSTMDEEGNFAGQKLLKNGEIAEVEI